MKASIALLESFSLVKRTTHDNFTIHPVVHTWARERLQITEKEKIIKKLLPVLNRVMSQEAINRESPEWNGTEERRLFVHLNIFNQLLKKELGLILTNTIIFKYNDLEFFDTISSMASVFDNKYVMMMRWSGTSEHWLAVRRP